VGHAVFATVFAVFMPLFWSLNYVSGVTAWKILLAAFATGRSILLIMAVPCLVIYFNYKYYLVHKEQTVMMKTYGIKYRFSG
jgi:hypothetical protein